jgi:aspartokinase-like uncharacterized kinase
MCRPLAVVKVGGSLLDWPELPAGLRRVIDERSGSRLVLIVGGGRAADAVRGLDRAYRLGDEVSHALALRALDLTAHALAAIVPGLQPAESRGELATIWATGRVPVLAPRRVLDADEGSRGALAHSWSVTSDAIAARVAALLGASSLLLLKSAPIPEGCDREAAARLGLIDPAFAGAARGVPRVEYLDLRGGERAPRPI